MRTIHTKTDKAIRAIRQATGLTQHGLAEMLGAPVTTVKSWTRRRYPNQISPQIEARLTMATGAVIQSNGTVRTHWRVGADSGLANMPFTEKSFKFWRTHVAKSDDAVAGHYAELAGDSIRRIFSAASKPVRGQRNKLPAVWQSFSDWLVNTSEDFNLKKQLDIIGKDYFWRTWQRPPQNNQG